MKPLNPLAIPSALEPTLESSVTSFLRLLETRQYAEARKVADELPASLPHEKRMREQMISQTLICQGEFAEARDRLSRAREEWGDHLRVLADLTTCHYLLEANLSWKSSVQELKAQYLLHAEGVCDNTFYRASIVLGKQLEELGELAIALDIYTDVTNRFKDEPFSLEFLRASAQILRVKSICGISSGLGALYENLRLLSESETRYNLFVETQHALVLAEIHLVGFDAAYQRMMRLLKRADLKKSDLQLIGYDCIDASLSRGVDAANLAGSEWLTQLPAPRDLYERKLLQLCDPTLEPNSNFKDLLGCSDLLPAAGYLRLLSLKPAGLEPSLSLSVDRQVYLLVDSLDRRSRELWLHRCGISRKNETERKAIRLSAFDRCEILFENRVLSMARLPALWELLQCLEGHQELSVDALSTRLYGTSASESHFERLRKTVQKLNRLLTEITLLPAPIRLTRQTLRVAPQIDIRRMAA